MSTLDIITLIANVSLSLSFIVALVFGIGQSKAAARDRKERFTLETLRNFKSREFSELMYYVNVRDLPKTLEEWRKQPDQEEVIFLQFTQEMESLGILVAERFLDIELVDKTLGSLVTTTWEKFKPVILDIRIKQPDPFLSEYFQWLAERLAERMKRNPRIPFHESQKET